MRLMIGHEKGKTFISVHENDRVITTAAGATVQEAAEWLEQHLDRLVRQGKKLLDEAGLGPGKRGKRP